jgi:hypothetical protein
MEESYATGKDYDSRNAHGLSLEFEFHPSPSFFLLKAEHHRHDIYGRRRDPDLKRHTRTARDGRIRGVDTGKGDGEVDIYRLRACGKSQREVKKPI